jgi:hypothetical protein
VGRRQLGSDLAIKCATHSRSNDGGSIWGSSVPEAHTYEVSPFPQTRIPATRTTPMCRRVYDRVCWDGVCTY